MFLPPIFSTTSEKHTIAASSIFYFGEIGFNDYSFALSAGNGTVDVAASLVPDIIAVIRSAVTVRAAHTTIKIYFFLQESNRL